MPERIEGFLVLNMAHPWVQPKVLPRHLWRFLVYQPAVAIAGVPLHRHTRFLELTYRWGRRASTRRSSRVYTERFRDPVVARTARDTYRTFLLREIPRVHAAVSATGDRADPRSVREDDAAIHPSLARAETARADDYTLEIVDGGHFIIDEHPDLVRAKLIALVEETAAAT